MMIKNARKSVKILICALSMTLTCSAFAATQNGTNSGGGGSYIEAGFKDKMISVAQKLLEMSEASAALLKFDRDELMALVLQHNTFKPLCASGSLLKRMQQEQKMARVYPENPNVVNLDCDKYKLEDWKSLFNSEKNGDIIFFIHEGLRIVNQENEDDYSVSSSYIKASASEEKRIAQLAYRYVYKDQFNACKFQIIRLGAKRHDIYIYDTGYFAFYVDGNMVWRSSNRAFLNLNTTDAEWKMSAAEGFAFKIAALDKQYNCSSR